MEYTTLEMLIILYVYVGGFAGLLYAAEFILSRTVLKGLLEDEEEL